MDRKNLLKNTHYRSLSRNIIWIILVVSITPLLLVGIFILRQSHVAYEKKVYDHLEVIVRKHKQNIELFLKERLGNIQVLATSSSYEQLCDESFLQRSLAELQEAYENVFVDLGLVNDHGLQIAYAGPFELSKAGYSGSEWFKKTLNSPYFISNVFSGLRGHPHFIVAVRRVIGGRSWILRATIDFGAFNTLVENLRIGKSGFAFIMNKSGDFQTNPVFGVEVGEKKYYLNKFLGSKNEALEEIHYAVREDNTGPKTIYASTFLKDGEWLMVVQQESEDAFSDLRRTEIIAISILILGGFGIISMALMLSGRLISRISSLDREREIAAQEKEMMSQQVIETGKLASIGELAAGIAHEINNPVAIMTEEAGWIHDLLEEEEFQNSENLQEFHRALEQIHTQGKRCKDITHKLLSFARKTDSSIKEVLLNDLLNEVAYLSSQRAKYSNILINTKFHKNLPPIRASETELQQVFLNLVNNALDAMEKTDGTIDITSKTEGNDIVIVVADNGPGIANANLARIFDPFFTTKPVGKGTGLGLSICYGIIKKMGGEIDVRSGIDKGTTFTIRLPANREGEERIAQLSPDFDPDENTSH